ncbi:hypothetical protein BH23PLA1_BH23PLA1_22080 [soil metagenome]
MERLIKRIKPFHGVAARYVKTGRYDLGLIHVAAVMILSRPLVIVVCLDFVYPAQRWNRGT